MTEARQCERAPELSEEAPDRIGLEVLHERLAGEFCRMSILVGTVEHAVGECLDANAGNIAVPVIALQGLDRVRQTLEDFHRLASRVSRQLQENGNQALEIPDLREAFLMRENADRLLAPAVGGHGAREEHGSHELWDP